MMMVMIVAATTDACNSDGYTNDVTARFLTIGEYGATGDEQAYLNAKSPDGARPMFRGGAEDKALTVTPWKRLRMAVLI